MAFPTQNITQKPENSLNLPSKQPATPEQVSGWVSVQMLSVWKDQVCLYIYYPTRGAIITHLLHSLTHSLTLLTPLTHAFSQV